MRTRTGEDFKAMSFELKVLFYSIAKIQSGSERSKKVTALEEVIIEMVSDLPLSVNVVAKEKQLIEDVLHNNYLAKSNEEGLEILIQRIAPLMKNLEKKG